MPLLSRLVQELALFDQRQEDKASLVKKETVQISDDYSTLSQTLDDLLADEGFAELDIDSPKVITQLILISVTSLRIY